MIVKEKEHKVFKRKQADIAMDLEISLKDALCGFERQFKHLDGKIHVIKSNKGEVIGPNDIKTVFFAGFPLF